MRVTWFSGSYGDVELNGKHGAVDKTGKLVVPVLYDDIITFSQGLASVEVRGQSGYVDLTGQMVIEPQFGMAREFHEGLAGVQIMLDRQFQNGLYRSIGSCCHRAAL